MMIQQSLTDIKEKLDWFRDKTVSISLRLLLLLPSIIFLLILVVLICQVIINFYYIKSWMVWIYEATLLPIVDMVKNAY